MSRLLLPPRVVRQMEEEQRPPQPEGLGALMQREQVPKGSPCPCGARIPWKDVARTSAAEHFGLEYEVQCGRCDRLYTACAGSLWEAR